MWCREVCSSLMPNGVGWIESGQLAAAGHGVCAVVAQRWVCAVRRCGFLSDGGWYVVCGGDNHACCLWWVPV